MNSPESTALWLTVAALGAWHGLNPGMGWPLAVANGLMARRAAALPGTLLPLAAGHLLAMAVVLLPFVALGTLLAWQREIRIGAGLLVVAYGAWRLIDRRHPRFLARVRPTQLVLWSFLMATAHGAGLMLLPFALGLCMPAASAGLPAAGLAVAGVAAVHTGAMFATGLVAAWAVYRWLGLKALARSWIDLDAVWGASLVLAGAASVAVAL
ncbi:hypothetical protein [Azohydromonas caseinilytica]|uniref:hypothetical protein n=1 Tax=Azohydromonas caseinilytica TaxID=2728836 RepID=UPI001F3286D7|nr:hypothetical protein [Azohydromonas caseinilytica]